MMDHDLPATDGTARTSPVAGSSSTPSGATSDSVRIIAMLNQKGGVGKTTSTVNLGAALAEAGQRVCLIDLDPQAHLTFHLGIDAERMQRSVYDLLLDPECYASEAIINARKNLDVILSETDLAAAETELATTDERQLILRRKFESIASAYDVVIMDCPPSLGLLTMNALSLAKEVFVPMQAHFLALQGVGKLLETVGLVCGSINPQLRVGGIVLCMHEQQTTLAREIVADLDAFFQAAQDQDVPWNRCRVLRPPIRRNVKLAEAPSFGKTIFDYDPTCAGAADYRALADDLLQGWGRKRVGEVTKPAGKEVKSKVVSISPAEFDAKTQATNGAAPTNATAGPKVTVEVKPGVPVTALAAEPPMIETTPMMMPDSSPPVFGSPPAKPKSPARKAMSVSPPKVDSPAA